MTTLVSSTRAREVIMRARELGQGEFKEYSKVSVKRDMTPLERDEMRNLVRIRNLKRDETTQKGTGEVWVIRKGRVVDKAR